ncbi:disks large homolog 5-like isoform X2 [Peromyscus californicus insignis]|uniref:disks large homolog 5-like isoform X2 n=1 Tax=Peromyscus californicus insignis TaxID=564181 RepID=UPI0022A6691D|nr:disks large homolog 5-like isoform X2 [Peromyscus californicus insignis]
MSTAMMSLFIGSTSLHCPKRLEEGKMSSGTGVREGCELPFGTTGKASTPTSLTEQEQQMNKVDKLTRQLQMMTNERNELSIILANFTNNDLNNRLNFELEMLNMEHKKVMVDLEKFPNEIIEALNKCKELTEETVSYSILHSQLLSEWTHLKEKVSILREENRKLRGEQISLQESCEELRRLCGETHEKIYDLWAKEKQKQERLEDRLQYLLKQRDLVSKHKVLAEKLQHYFTVSQMSPKPNRESVRWKTVCPPASSFSFRMAPLEHHLRKLHSSINTSSTKDIL